MIAIRLCESNRRKIVLQNPFNLPNEDLNAMIEEYGNRPDNRAIYFVPQYESENGTHVGSWATIPREYLLMHYELEKPIDELDHTFVEITRK